MEIVPRVKYDTTVLVAKKCFEAKYNFSKDKTKKMLQVSQGIFEGTLVRFAGALPCALPGVAFCLLAFFPPSHNLG